jgi:hypothetical protein
MTIFRLGVTLDKIIPGFYRTLPDLNPKKFSTQTKYEGCGKTLDRQTASAFSMVRSLIVPVKKPVNSN